MRSEINATKDKPKTVLYVLSLIMIIIAIPHFIYAAWLKEILIFYEDYSDEIASQNNFQFSVPPAAFYCFVGITQILINAFYMLQLRRNLQNAKLRLDIIIIFLICELGMVSTIALYNSMLWAQNQDVQRWILNFSEEQLHRMSIDQTKLYNNAINLYKLCGIESNLCFLLGVPIIILQFLLFFEMNNDIQQQSMNQVQALVPLQQSNNQANVQL